MKTRVVPINPRRPAARAIAQGAALLRAGELVAFPTETVYGLGADALRPEAVQKIFQVKGRPLDNPLIVHIADRDHLRQLARKVPPAAFTLTDRFWPGPLTLVLPRSAAIPPEVTGGLETVAVRMPAHPVALALIRESGVPVAAPSANRSGRPSPTTAAHVLRDLGGRIPLILDGGPTEIGVESTVLDLTGPTPVLLRPGGVTLEELQAVVGPVDLKPVEGFRRRSPGTRYRHYRPRARTVLVLGSRPGLAQEVVEAHQAAGKKVGLIHRGRHLRATSSSVLVKVLPKDIAGYARGLFAALRALDDAGVDIIVVEGVSEQGLGLAVMDRLRRAASEVVGGT
ncbi:MAG: threonylcarbamoyl-AMP synthase [candidate division NC10 bacterium]|nr:threonylcarbamoyl-AMP synthase [candidate division NC10 bacterium]